MRAQSGVATLEFHIVALLALLPICLGTLQVSLLLVANHYVDFAAFAAARAGSVSGGRAEIIESAFVDALLPLVARASGGIDPNNVVSRVAAAKLRGAAEAATFGRIQVLTPGPDAQRDFAIERDGQRVIPNDSLRARSAQPGPRSRLTLQQANILVLSATWCHPLDVPFAREVLVGVMRRLDPQPRNQICYAAMRMPIRARGVAPMQSDFVVR